MDPAVPSSPSPSITLNGNPHAFSPGSTIFTLLQSLNLAEVPVLVEHNATALFPREFSSTVLAADDRVEIIRIVAGG
jgi:thiamine biosynthesis protein ThiS